MRFGGSRRDPTTGDVLMAALGVGGLAMCITLVFRGMRAVMDIGGECADGATYVAAPPCPEGVPIALVGGIFGGFLFGAIAMVYGSRIGGIWGAVPLLAWTALFATLGWNFLDYGLFNPPPEADGIVWGWIVPGVVFEVMAWAPLVFLVVGWRATRRAGPQVDFRPAGIGASRVMPGPGQPVRDTTDTPWAHATVGMVEGTSSSPRGARRCLIVSSAWATCGTAGCSPSRSSRPRRGPSSPSWRAAHDEFPAPRQRDHARFRRPGRDRGLAPVRGARRRLTVPGCTARRSGVDPHREGTSGSWWAMFQGSNIRGRDAVAVRNQ